MRSRPLRVVFLGHSAKLSGAELGLVELLPALEQVAPHVVLAEDGPLVDRLRGVGVPVDVVPLAARTQQLRRDDVRPRAGIAPAALATAAYSLRLVRHLRRLRPDLVEAGTLKALLYGGAAAKLAARPLVWHVHDRIAPDYLPPGAVRVVRRTARAAARGVIANSRATLATVGPLQVPATVVHEPVRHELFATRRRARPTTFTVAMLGRIAPWKGQDVFVRAFARAFPDGTERAVVIGSPLFGEQEYERGLLRLVEDLGLRDRVELRGFRDDVAAELARVDALVHASVIPEPFGRVVVEGMAAGLPVVAADAGGPNEILTDGIDGLLHRPGDVAALAAALRRIAHDPELAARLGRAASESARRFSPEAAAAQTTDFYRRVLAAA